MTSITKEDLCGKRITVPSTSLIGQRDSLTTGTIAKIAWSWVLKNTSVCGKIRSAIVGFCISVNDRPVVSKKNDLQNKKNCDSLFG